MNRGKRIQRNVIFAHGIHSGGGLVLLEALWGWVQTQDVMVILDERLCGRVPDNVLPKCVFFEQGLLGRLKSEWYVKDIAHPEGLVLSFNSIPPVFKPVCKYVVFFQNVNLLKTRIGGSGNYIIRVKNAVKAILFRRLTHSSTQFIVQTRSVCERLTKALGPSLGCKPLVLPFLPKTIPDSLCLKTERLLSEKLNKVRFIYVADGLPHKNHLMLVRAWKLLALDVSHNRCELALTLGSNDDQLWAWIEREANQHDLSIINLGSLTRKQMDQVYKECDALIYPSVRESFGLPLIEASQLGKDIIASERDFVRDVCAPIHSFDPNSPLSISRAILRYVSEGPVPSPSFIDGTVFLNRVFVDRNYDF